jgi:hypothetical protein
MMIPVTEQQANPAVPLASEDTWRGTFFVPPAHPSRAPRDRGEFRRGVLRLLREPFTRRARKERWYSFLSLPLAIAGFAFTVITVTAGLGMSGSLTGMLVGLPLLVVSSLGARKLGAVNRGLAGRLPPRRCTRGQVPGAPPRPRGCPPGIPAKYS